MMVDKISMPNNPLPEILLISSYPPRECGIATYSEDLKKSLDSQFSNSFTVKVCALESKNEKHSYPQETEYILDVDLPGDFVRLVKKINNSPGIRMVLIQHEFGFFASKEDEFIQFIGALAKPAIIVFHTVLPHPDEMFKRNVQKISETAESVVVMTKSSAEILITEYAVQQEKIAIIPHGTHLIRHLDEKVLKNKYHLAGKKVLSTFGLLSQGKSIETTLDVLPAVVKENQDIMFLIIGKTHPSVVKQEGEKYRSMLEAKVIELQLQPYVRFINYFLPLPDLLEYLQLTDIYLFTSKDPNQAVSGTFSYAISCGCPVISTPIPHAREVLKDDGGIVFDFGNSRQLSHAITELLNNDSLRKNIGSNGLHRMASTAWENASIAHAMLFQKVSGDEFILHYNMPPVNLEYVKKMTTDFGVIQFSKLNHPDIKSGYTLDDNARALIAICRYFELSGDETSLGYVTIFLDFIKYCQQAGGQFFNYVNGEREFTEQNAAENLEDSNGRAVWALGYVLSLDDLLPAKLIANAESIMQAALLNVKKIHSARAMAFVIKGLYYRTTKRKSEQDLQIVKELADRLVQMYRHEKSAEWFWFESYLTYANSILPEAMLLAWLLTRDTVYKEIARESFDFLLSIIFTDSGIKVISNTNWLHKGQSPSSLPTGGEQPIDVAYTIIALKQFYKVFGEDAYRNKMKTAFSWFLGNNHLHQIIYNPCTGGCYDGLEENYVNLNQGAESTISYLLARLTLDPGNSGAERNGKRIKAGDKHLSAIDIFQE